MKGSVLRLIVEKGPSSGEIVECGQASSIKVGRVLKGNTFTIRDSGISQQHLVVQFRVGRWVILDLDSSNGTMLQDERIPPQTPCAIKDGDVIKIGTRSVLYVRILEEEGDPGVAGKSSPVISEKPSAEVTVRRNPKRGARAAASARSTSVQERISVDVGNKKKAKLRKNNLGAVAGRDKEVSIAQHFQAAEECSEEMEKNVVVNGLGLQQLRIGEKDDKEIGGEQPGSGKNSMESITLGLWLDRMEIWLPKQIRAVCEDLVGLMRERAIQVEAFVSQQGDRNKAAA